MDATAPKGKHRLGSDADVIVVGAGPAGAATAYHLATAGVDVVVLEKSKFPRDKVCGDGLTPAAVREIRYLGADPLNEPGWAINKGLCVIGGGHRIYLPWPEQESLPGYGLARRRLDLDHYLIKKAVAAGARLEQGVTVTGPIQNRAGYLEGVTASREIAGDKNTGKSAKSAAKEDVSYRARLVVDCSGVAARLSTKVGREKHPNRPMAVAARTYFKSSRANEQWMESHLELWDGPRGKSNLLAGYGWMFPLPDGTVNVGLGSVSSGAEATKLPYKKIFTDWIANLPESWGLTPANQDGPLRSAALPMCFNRTPHYADGLVLVGDAGGMVSPFNGEGIAPAMLAGRKAAETIVQAFGRPTRAGFETAMAAYPSALKAEYGGYYQLGRAFVRLIENPKIMRLCTKYGLPHPQLMKLVHKLLSDGFERRGGDFSDRLITALTKAVPSV